MTNLKTCDGCAEEKDSGTDAVCMECTTARAGTGDVCRCGRKKRPQQQSAAGHTWTTCQRCFKNINEMALMIAEEQPGANQ